MAATSVNRSNTLTRGRRAQLGGKAHHAGRNGRTHFLNASFASIPGCEIPNDEAAIGLVDADMRNIHNDVNKFFSTYGIACELPAATGNFKKDILALYNVVKENLPNKDWSLEVVRQNGDSGPIKFVVYCYAKFSEYTVWAMPVKKMATADDKTRKLLALTFAVLSRKDMYEFPENNYDFQYCLGQCENDFMRDEEGHTKFDEYVEEYWDEEYKGTAVRYLDGDIQGLFAEIVDVANHEADYGKPLDFVLEDTLHQYREEEYPNTHLLDIIAKELELCREDWLSDYHLSMIKNEFGYDFGEEDGNECELMDFARIFFFCYDSEDCITQAAIDSLNSEAYNLDIGTLCRYSFIDSDDVKKRMENDFPERWADINLKLINELK